MRFTFILKSTLNVISLLTISKKYIQYLAYHLFPAIKLPLRLHSLQQDYLLPTYWQPDKRFRRYLKTENDFSQYLNFVLFFSEKQLNYNNIV